MALTTTYLELVNDVLVRLREPQVLSVSQNTYSSLIGKLINDAKKINVKINFIGIDFMNSFNPES